MVFTKIVGKLVGGFACNISYSFYLFPYCCQFSPHPPQPEHSKSKNVLLEVYLAGYKTGHAYFSLCKKLLKLNYVYSKALQNLLLSVLAANPCTVQYESLIS